MDDDVPETLGELIRRHRGRAGLTQQALADQAGMSIRALRDIEQDRVRRPRTPSVQRLTTALRLDDADRAAVLATLRPKRPGAGFRPDQPGAGFGPEGPGAGFGPDPGHGADRRLRVGVLGPLSVRRDGASVDLGSPMQRCLLGLLALQPRRVVPREEIIDVLWGENPPKTCHSLVHVYIGHLRDLLDPGRRRGQPAQPIARAGGGYRLELDADQLDVARFADLARRGEQARVIGETEAAFELLAQALQCWRGPVLAGAFARLRQHPATVALARQRLAATLMYADLAAGLERPAAAAAVLRALSHDEPLHEGLHARLILALAGCGEQAAALQLHAALRDRLAEELGIEPGAELRAAHLTVLRQQPPPREPAPVASPGTPAQLPADVAAFTGRQPHLKQLDELLTEERQAVVITAIAGSAGAGKTALAVHWAHRVRDRFGDGQLYVNLRGFAPTAPLRPIEALAQLLHALGVAAERVPVDVEQAAGLYRSLLAGKRMLIVLDNAQHAEHVRSLLPGSPGCLALITSRDQLTGLVAREGAHRLALDVLTADEASALLARVLGGRRVAAEPTATAELARVCARLPLALRIAAANLSNDPHRSIAAHVAELRAGNRLAALEVDGDEQTAVRAAFDLSYAALPVEARRLFRLLGLIPGPDVTADAAAALTSSSVAEAKRTLDRLASAHLIAQHAPGRYTFHDLLRLYAAERTQQDDSADGRAAATRRLYDFYLHTADSAARVLYPDKLRLPLPAGPAGLPFDDHARAVEWLDAERPNLVAAVQHAAVVDAIREASWLLADTLRGYFWLRLEAVDWLAVAHAGLVAALAGDDLRAQGAAQLSLADVHLTQGQQDRAIEHYTRALDLSRATGWLDGQAAGLGNLGTLYSQSGRLREAAEHYNEALALDEPNGRVEVRAFVLGSLGIVHRELGRLAESADQHAEALALSRKLGFRGSEAIDLASLSDTEHALGRFDEALEHVGQALTMHREVGDRNTEADTLRILAALYRDTGRHIEAVDIARTALALARDTGSARYEADILNTLASIHHRLAQYAEAIDHHQQAIQVARDAKASYPEMAARIGLAAAYHGLGRYDEALGYASVALTITTGAGYRLLEGQARNVLAGIHLAHDRPDLAADEARRALAVHRDTGHRLGEADSHARLDEALRRAGEPDAADAHLRQARALYTDLGVSPPA